MVFFYLGVGFYFVFFSDPSYLDKSVRVIMGSTFIILWIVQGIQGIC